MSKIQAVPVPPPPAPRVWTTLELINWTKAFFEKKGIDTPRLEAELLLAAVLGSPRIRLYADFDKPVPPEKLAQFRECVKRRGETREPLQYIVGEAQFIDISVKVNRQVLIPRPETEVLGTWAAQKIGVPESATVSLPGTKSAAAAERVPGEISFRVLDLCTGSGCLALYLAKKQPAAEVHATDLSREALEVAAANARTLKLESQVKFHAGDLFAALPVELKGALDLIVSNPPYIDPAAKDGLQPEVRDHEPAQALFADEKGLGIIRRIIPAAAEWLKSGAWLALEFGFEQGEPVRQLAESTGAYAEVTILKDHCHLPRILTARKA